MYISDNSLKLFFHDNEKKNQKKTISIESQMCFVATAAPNAAAAIIVHSKIYICLSYLIVLI